MLAPPFDLLCDLVTPVSAFRKLAPLGAHFLLESVENGASMKLGRYSFLGFGDARHVRIVDDAYIDGPERAPVPTDRDGLMAALRASLARSYAPTAPGDTDIPFRGGLVGVAGFDTLRRLDRVRPSPASSGPPHPDMAYVSTRSLLVFDHLTRRSALLHDGSESERSALKKDVQRLLAGAMPTPAPGIGGTIGELTPNFARDAFLDAVKTGQDHIQAGDLFQLVLSVRMSAPCSLEPFEVYRALRILNPSPYMSYIDLGDDVQVIGSSPEALVKMDGNVASLRPIAGTRPRGQTEAEDLDHEKTLLADPKEAAEHVMLVDLARNDLGRIAEVGSVVVEPYRIIERYSHVMHIVSGVQATLRPTVDAFDVFAATFPAGTVVGAPKLRAAEIIATLEPERRGLYAGSVGYFGHGRTMDQAIAIRTMVMAGGQLTYQAGAGIVADSVPDREYQECLHKGAAMKSALQLAAGGLS